VIEMLLADRELARKSGQSSAGIRATELLGKELGMFVDRSANRHSLGGRRFSELEPEEQRREAIPHHRVVDMLVHTLSFYGHEVIEQHHGVTKDGLRYFGLLSLRSPYTGYADTVGLRNSHRQDLSYRHRLRPKSSSATASPSSPIMSSGANTPPTPSATCPGLVGDLVEPLTEQREAQDRLAALQRRHLRPRRAHRRKPADHPATSTRSLTACARPCTSSREQVKAAPRAAFINYKNARSILTGVVLNSRPVL
jgi:hypothetical protein